VQGREGVSYVCLALEEVEQAEEQLKELRNKHQDALDEKKNA
jgi:hypothetical protein